MVSDQEALIIRSFVEYFLTQRGQHTDPGSFLLWEDRFVNGNWWVVPLINPLMVGCLSMGMITDIYLEALKRNRIVRELAFVFEMEDDGVVM